MFQQLALRLHPAGVLYLTLRFNSLQEAYNRSPNTMAPLGQLFGVGLERVLEQEASGFLVPLLIKLCIQVGPPFLHISFSFSVLVFFSSTFKLASQSPFQSPSPF